MSELEKTEAGCSLCPRSCGALRAAGQIGYCGAGAALRVARAGLHHWEEPPVSGTNGSGTVFFSNCPLRCVYCQNREISLGGWGIDIDTVRLSEIFLELACQGAHNINLVTGTQYTIQIIEALQAARAAGFDLPVIWNSSGYEDVATLSLLAGNVDAYLLDYRYSSSGLAAHYSTAPDYPVVAAAALAACLGQVGEFRLDESGLLVSGVIVRFLLLPGQLEDAIKSVDKVFYLAGNAVCYSLLSQFTPFPGLADTYPELNGPIRGWDYDVLVDHVLNLGIKHSFMQAFDSAASSYTPAFDLTGVLLDGLR
ncbi:MAG: radical SAM protein [Coriobacteriia bacterium]|nr:radical SAM protein [Coriobacteriia bacterium]